jgi:hypothetical protein
MAMYEMQSPNVTPGKRVEFLREVEQAFKEW